MPSPIRVPIYERSSSDTAPPDEDGNDAITAYLTPLLTKHDRGQPLIYEDLLESYEVAKAVAASSANGKAKQELENLHKSQLAAYETCARTELAKLAEGRAYPDIEKGESMPRYIERAITTMKDDHQKFAEWRVSNDVMEEVFWSKVKAGARKAYFAFKSQSIEKDKQTADQTTGKVKAFESAALGALVSKSEPQDLGMAHKEEEKDGDVEENDMTDGDEVDDEDGEEEEEEEEAEEDGEDDDAEVDGEDIVDEDGKNEVEADEEDAVTAAAEDNGMPPAKTPMKTNKRRRLPNGPLGGGGAGTTTDGGKKQQPTKKQKTSTGANGDATDGGGGRGSNGGRGKGGAKSGRAGRGGGGGRGTRKRNRKKGSGGAA